MRCRYVSALSLVMAKERQWGWLLMVIGAVIMPSASSDNLGPLELAQRILELRHAVDREVRGGKYETAARLRDEREALQNELKRSGNHTLMRRFRLARHPEGPR